MVNLAAKETLIEMNTRVESRLKTWSLRDKGPPFSGDYRRSFTSEHLTRRRVSVASLAANLIVRALDSPAFDRVLAGAKSAAIAYATKKASDFIGGLTMPRKNKGKKVMAVLAKAKQVSSTVPVRLEPMGTRRKRPKGPGLNPHKRGGGWTSRRVSVPSASGRVMRNKGAAVNGRGPTTVCHSEYLGEVSGSVAFNNTAYPINPGLVQSFPWLANIAAQYEQYRFKRLSYRYETQAPSTKAGAVLLVTDFDALDVPFTSKDQAMQYKGATRTVTWTRAVHRSDTREAGPYRLRYVRSTEVPEGGDAKTYDVGLFQLITGGQADASSIGELYVDYEIELVGPKTNNIIGANLLGADIRSGGTITTLTPLGSAPNQVAGTTLTVVQNSGAITISASGRFLVYYYLTGSAITSIGIAPGGGALGITDYGSGINAAGTAAWACKSIDYVINQGNAVGLSIAATTYTSSTLVVSQISGALAAPKPRENKRMPILKLDDPITQRLAQLEALVRKMGLGCPDCGSVGEHAPGCAFLARPRPATTRGI